MINEGRRRPQAAAEGAPRRDRGRQWLREAYTWRWPAGVLAALVLWLALVTLVGASVPSIEKAERREAARGNAGATGAAVATSCRREPVRRWGLWVDRILRDRSGRL